MSTIPMGRMGTPEEVAKVALFPSALPFSHGGGNDGFRCLLAAFADSGKGVVIMTNSDNATNLIVEIVRSIAAEYGFPPE